VPRDPSSDDEPGIEDVPEVSGPRAVPPKPGVSAEAAAATAASSDAGNVAPLPAKRPAPRKPRPRKPAAAKSPSGSAARAPRAASAPAAEVVAPLDAEAIPPRPPAPAPTGGARKPARAPRKKPAAAPVPDPGPPPPLPADVAGDVDAAVVIVPPRPPLPETAADSAPADVAAPESAELAAAPDHVAADEQPTADEASRPAPAADESEPVLPVEDAIVERTAESVGEPAVDGLPAEPAPEEVLAEPVSEESPAEAVSEESPAETVTEESLAERVSEESPAETVAEEVPAETSDPVVPADETIAPEPAVAVAGAGVVAEPEIPVSAEVQDEAAGRGEHLETIAAASAADPALADGFALSVRGVTKSFGGTRAVDGIDLTVPAGTFYGLVGPNGAGKTTTLSMIAGLLRPDRGTIEVNGVDAAARPRQAKRLMGVLPDRLRTFDRLTGRQLLYYCGVLRGLDAAVVESRAADLARAFDLTEALGRPVSDYSAGMTKKVMLAGAMIHSPRLLVLDEPFEAVDPVSSAVILDILSAYVAHGGTVILSSHGMDLVERVCSRVAVIVAGQVLAEGTVDEVRGELTLEQRFIELAGGLSDVEGLEWLHTFSG
jgi:ABC-2 type transport system ATP-binding protein